MMGYSVVALLTGIVSTAALHLDRDDIRGLAVMNAASLCIETTPFTRGRELAILIRVELDPLPS